jgi:hypothetical protein
MTSYEDIAGRGFKVGPRAEEGKRQVQLALGRLVMEWNFAEHWLGMLAGALIGRHMKPLGSQPAGEGYLLPQTLVAELGSVDIANLLHTLASDVLAPELGAAVAHAAAYHERLREFRNAFVHGIENGTDIDGFGYVGLLHSISAKQALVFKAAHIPVADIDMIADRCVTLRKYADGIIHHIGAGIVQPKPGEAPPELPHKPPLPRKKPTTPRYWRETAKRPKLPRPK